MMKKKPYKKMGQEAVPRMIPSKYRHEASCANQQSYQNGIFDTLNTANKILSPEDFLSLVEQSGLGFDAFMKNDAGHAHLKFMASLKTSITISDLILEAKGISND